jgi:hypothetical protein
MEKNSLLLDYLYKEHKEMVDKISKFEDRIDNIIVSSILIIGTITALISNKNEGDIIKNIVIAIPISAIVVLSVYCISYYKLMLYGGYKKYIEERIVNIIGKKEIGWENYLSDKNKRFNFLSVSIYSFYIIVLIGLSIFSLYHVLIFNKLIFLIEALLLLFSLSIFFFTLLKMGFKIYNDTYNYFKNKYLDGSKIDISNNNINI